MDQDIIDVVNRFANKIKMNVLNIGIVEEDRDLKPVIGIKAEKRSEIIEVMCVYLNGRYEPLCWYGGDKWKTLTGIKGHLH